MFEASRDARLFDIMEKTCEPDGPKAGQADIDVQACNHAWLRDRFAEDREMAADYLRAMAAYPWLFRTIEPSSLAGHVEGVVGHFKGDGLSREQYFSAVAAYPPLAQQKAAVVIDNVEQVLGHYRDDGLSRCEYLQAAVDQPTLFRTSPQTVIDNITDLEEWLPHVISSTSDCLRKAVDRPRLFTLGVDALPTIPIAPISEAVESAALASAGHVAAEGPNPVDHPALVEETPTTQVSAPVIYELTRALRTRGQAA
jgi:hypothetical protein